MRGEKGGLLFLCSNVQQMKSEYNTRFTSHKRERRNHGERKRYGQSPEGEERSMDDAGVHQGQAVQSDDADDGS